MEKTQKIEMIQKIFDIKKIKGVNGAIADNIYKEANNVEWGLLLGDLGVEGWGGWGETAATEA